MASVLAACSSDPMPPPETPPVPLPQPTLTVPDNKKPTAATAPVGVDDRIVKMCSLPVSHFDFDSSSIGGNARDALKAIANCFMSGPAKGKAVRIVGHADPRGETEYNFALGQQRAASVAQYLTRAGMPEGKIATSSRGELEASGSDRATWAKDRKVEIYLAD
jgi:peptidoglycan-associated lipoprotein